MPYQCLDTLSTWRLTSRYFSLLLNALHAFLNSIPLESILLGSFPPYWELALMSETCFRQFLSLNEITLRSHLNLILLLL